MALSLVLPSLPPVPPTFLGEGERRAPHALWGDETKTGGHRGTNITLTHVLPIAVRPDVVESYMTPNPLQSNVSLLMSMTHNTKRRVPRHYNPAVFPRNDPERVDHYGNHYKSTGETRKSLERCTDSLYGSSWASRAFPDYSQSTQRLQKSPKLLQKLHQANREVLNDHEAFPHITVYRASYSKHSPVEDQGRVCLPPIQWKTSYVNDEEEEQEDDKTEEDDVTKHHEKQMTGQVDTVHVRPLPYCESLLTIRKRLRSEGWALPNTYPMCHQLSGYFTSENRQVRSQRKPSSTETEISDPVTLIPGCSARPPSPKCRPEDMSTRHIDFAQTQSIEADRGTRRVIFNSNRPEVERLRLAPPFKPHYSLSPQVFPEVEYNEDPEVEWGTDEMKSSGFRGRNLLPRLQDRDFKTLCQARYHQTHVDKVPDLRDYATYRKRVNFSGFNSAVFRG